MVDRTTRQLSARVQSKRRRHTRSPSPLCCRRRLVAIRRDGYAWTDQELDLEVNGLAVPVVDGTGATVAIATLYGPSYRFAESLSPDLGRRFADFVAARSSSLVG